MLLSSGTKTNYFADTGAQPLINDDGTLILCVNGEIYNHKQLRKELDGKTLDTDSKLKRRNSAETRLSRG